MKILSNDKTVPAAIRENNNRKVVMALKKINAMLEAVSIGKGKGRKDHVAGFLVSAKFKVGKTKKKKGNTLYRFDDGKGNEFELWGNASINSALCDGDQPGDSLKLVYVGCWIDIRFVRIGKAKAGQSAPNICDVSADTARRLKVPGVTTFKLKPAKRLKK